MRSSKEPRSGGGGNRRVWIAVGAAALVLVAIGGGIALAMGGGDGSPSAGAIGDACEVQTFEALAQDHVPPAKLPEGFKYNSYPPSSGPHYPDPLIFGEYSTALEQNRLLHNLEHGGVGVQYGSNVSAETIAELTAWYRNDPRGLVLAPLPEDPRATKYADSIVLTAWVADREDPTDPGRGADEADRRARDLLRVRRGRVRQLHRRLPRPRPRALHARPVSTRLLDVCRRA